MCMAPADITTTDTENGTLRSLLTETHTYADPIGMLGTVR